MATALLLSCGPEKSTVALFEAHRAIHMAESGGAKDKHPYELQLAKEYYIKAKEEAGYSQFELSERLAKQAVSYAKLSAGEAVATPTPAEEGPIPLPGTPSP